MAALLRVRGCCADPGVADTLAALKILAQRHRDLSGQIAALTARIDPLATTANPALRAAFGVGADTAAQILITAGHNPDRLTSEPSFAALCGVAPVPASSGKTRRYRLSRGGDRTLTRTSPHRVGPDVPPPTHHRLRPPPNRPRPVDQGDPPDAETGHLPRDLSAPHQAPPHYPTWTDLRLIRQANNLTLTAAAAHFGVWPTVLSRHRTRTPTQRRTRPALPDLARRLIQR